MEPNNDSSGLSSYFLHQLHGQSPPPPPTSAAPGNLLPANGVVPNSTTTTNMAYLHSVPSAVSSPLETVKRKRGRPRKYGTPEQAAAAKRMSGSSVPKKRDNQDLTAAAAAGSSGSYSYHSKKSQLAALGNPPFLTLVLSVHINIYMHVCIMYCFGCMYVISFVCMHACTRITFRIVSLSYVDASRFIFIW